MTTKKAKWDETEIKNILWPEMALLRNKHIKHV